MLDMFIRVLAYIYRNRHKATMVIAVRAHCNPLDIYIYIYIYIYSLDQNSILHDSKKYSVKCPIVSTWHGM